MDTYEKKIREYLNNSEVDELYKNMLLNLFPELKESEDEKVRKELIDAIQGLWDNDALPMPLSVKRKDEWLAWLEKQGEQKPEWTLMDEQRVENFLAIVEGHGYPGEVAWLNSLKDRVQPKQKWSEKDEKIRQTILNQFEQCSEWCCSNGLTKEDCINWLNKQKHFKWDDEDNENMNSLCVLLDQMVSINAIGNKHSIEYKNWLKSLKDRVQPKQEWIEEDEDILNFIIARLHSHPNIKFEEYNKEYNWLKAIKQRIEE